MLQGLLLLWVFEFNVGSEDWAAALLDHFRHAYRELGLHEIQVSEVPSTESPARTEIQGMSSILWGLYCMDA